MSKERLEDIKEDIETNTRKEYEFITTILYDDAWWLIERVQELEQQNKRYREAIEFGIEYLKNSDIRQVQLVVTALKSALEGEE